MTRRQLVFYTTVLLGMGTGWGLTQPLAKIAVSTGYQQFGLIFWQMVIGVIALGGVTLIRGRSLPLTGQAVRLYLIIALIGTIIPNAASFKALVHIPAGVQSVLMSLVPMVAFPVALTLSLERFEMRRLAGLALGLAGVLLLILPEASLPDRTAVPWLALTLVAVVFYAFEGNFVARWGLGGLNPIQVLLGASVVGAIITLPLALVTGQFISPLRPFGAAEWALVGSSVIHAVVYALYVWLVGGVGSVFAAQVGYVVTATGVLWAMLILNESYSSWFWAAAGLILMGVFLVHPRHKDSLAQ